MTEPFSAGRPLPRGPHRLSREEVEQSQRARLLLGIAEVVATKGYAATSVADVLTRAGVSRTTFYELFDDKLDCFLAAYQMASDVLLELMAEELDEPEHADDSTPFEKLERLLSAYLRTLAENPVLARVFLVEVYAAGPRAIQRRSDSLEQFVDLVATTHPDGTGLLGPDADQRFAAEVLVSAVSSKVTIAVGLGQTEQLPNLRRPMLDFAAEILDPDLHTRQPS